MRQANRLLPAQTIDEQMIDEVRQVLVEQMGYPRESITIEQIEEYIKLVLAEIEPPIACIHMLIEQQALRTPTAVAVADAEESLSYHELNQRANHLAHYLGQFGVGPDILVGLYLEPSVALVVAALGVLKAGGAYLLLDPTDTAERRLMLLRTSKVPAVLTHARRLPALPAYPGAIVCLDDEWQGIAQTCDTNPNGLVTSDNLAYAVYAGQKGILVEHHSVCDRVSWLQETFPLSATDVVLHQSSLSWDTFVLEVWWPLCTGSRVIIAAQADPLAIQALIVAQHVTYARFSLASLVAFIKASSNHEQMPMHSLRTVLCSGQLLPQEVAEAFFQQFSCDLYYLHAVPEVAREITLLQCQPTGDRASLSIGQAAGDVAIYILDQYQQPVPWGLVGHIYIASSSLARAYLDNPDATSRRFVEVTFDDRSERMFNTGALGRVLNDGTLDLVGTVEHHVWIDEFRIDLAELEAAVRPVVEDCALVAGVNQIGQPELVGYIVVNPACDPQLLLIRVQELVPGALPLVRYVPLTTIPRTPAGTFDEQALRQSQALHAQVKLGIAATFTAEPLEESVAFWSKSLHLPLATTFAPYNQIFQQLLDPQSLLTTNDQGINVILLRLEDWVGSNPEDPAVARRQIEQSIHDLSAAIKVFRTNNQAPCLICVCPPSHEVAGDPLIAQMLKDLTPLLVRQLQPYEDMVLIDAHAVMTTYDVTQVLDPDADALGHIPYTADFFAAMGTFIIRKLCRLAGGSYPKVIAVDCEEVLWASSGDVLLVEPVHSTIQQYLVDQANHGRAICLLFNQHEAQLLALFAAQTTMPLQIHHLAAWQANDCSVAEKLHALAQACQVAMSDVLYLSRDRQACARVRAVVPEVLVVQLPDRAQDVAPFLNHVWTLDALA